MSSQQTKETEIDLAPSNLNNNNDEKFKIDKEPSCQLASIDPKPTCHGAIVLEPIELNKGFDNPFKRQEMEVANLETLVKPTFKRYIILILFCINAGNKAFQWIQIPASTTKATIYYDVDNYVINALSVIFMLAFIVLSWPACYIIDKIGLRWAVLAASFGAALGSVIKCFSCYEGGIYLLIFSQILVSLSEQLIFSVPNRLASVWFPDDQVSSAVALCVLGNQLGIALGFQVPQWFLEGMETKDQIGEAYYNMFLLTMGISVASFLFDVWLFDEEPKHPPGLARLKQRHIERAQGVIKKSFKEEMSTLFGQILKLCNNTSLMLLALSYGIRFSLTDTMLTLLNQMIRPIWPDGDIIIGNTGSIIIVAGSLALPLWGRCLDRFHCFKWLNIFLNFAAILSLVTFAYTLFQIHSPIGIYLSALFLGIFQVGSILSCLELAIELTYPAPELITSSLMNVMPQIFGTTFVFVGSYITDNHGALAISIFLVSCLSVALILVLFTRETLNRQAAVKEEQEKSRDMRESIEV